MPSARVLLYNHGLLHEHDSIEGLGQRLLTLLLQERHSHRSRRPLFFICHSTGGLVAKACLDLAARAEPYQAIVTSCYGIAFFATPHRGSSYLSGANYAPSIKRLLHLEQDIPPSLREQFRPHQKWLWRLSNNFKAISADMRVWSFLETVDSTLRVRDMETQNTVEFHAPITSIRSGLLDIEHEVELPMATDHAGTACFQGQQSMRDDFLGELNEAVDTAVKLSTQMDTPMNVEQEVLVQVNGFFEDTALGISDESPLKLWSTSVSLEDYLARGPATCLRERLRHNYPGELDDSSVSSFDSRHSVQHIVSGPAEQEQGHSHDTRDGHASAHRNDDRASPPALRRSRSFMDPAYQSPTIHITEVMDGQFERSPSESPPPPIERHQGNLITRARGLGHLQAHRRSTSDSSSPTSSPRPPL